MGAYLVSWRAVSGDGHPIGGATSFSLGLVSGGPPNGAGGADPKVSAALWVARLALSIGLFFGVGIMAFSALVAPLPSPAIRLAGTAILSGLAAAPISLQLNGMDALGLGFDSVLDPDCWAAGFSTSFGLSVTLALDAMMLAGLSLTLAGAISKALAIASLLAVPISLMLSGHAGAAEPQWITRPAMFGHVLGLVFWIGSLPPLLMLLAKDPGRATAPLARFSAIAPYPVATILVSGIVLAAIQLGARPIFWMSAYGAILSCKLALLSILFGLAIWNRFGLTGPALAGDAGAVVHLRRSIGFEVILILGVLALAAGWRFTPPPRSLAEASPAPVELRLQGSALTADISLSPGRTGINSVALFLTDGGRATVVPRQVAVVISSRELGIEPRRQLFVNLGGGFWQSSDLAIPLAGQWQMELEVRISRFDIVRLAGSIIIP